MAIRILDCADPLSDAALRSEGEVRTAQSDASRVLRLELTRYCRGEVNGRSFLIAGHRGAGKTTMVAGAVDKVLRRSRRPDENLLRPLAIFLHGPSLFELDEAEKSPPDVAAGAEEGAAGDAAETRRMAAQARVALKQIILGIHRAVLKEFATAYRERLVTDPAIVARPDSERTDLAELAAQFEVELAGDPAAARLREFWELADALPQGVLFDRPRYFDQGARELVALSGMCDAHQRISGDISSQEKTARAAENVKESSRGLDLRGAELASPFMSVLAGAVVAGGAAAGTRSVGGALLAGLATAIASTLFFKASATQTVKSSRQTDTIFIPDLSLKTLDRILPTLLQRLRGAGLAPVLVVDELDKVRGLPKRLEAMIHFLKKLVAENVFTCFLTDRGYLEHLRMQGRDDAYGRAYSYFSHPLLVTHQPADFAGFLDDLLRVDRAATSSAGQPGDGVAPVAASAEQASFDADTLDLEVLKWVLRHRSELHALALTREISSLRSEHGTLQVAPGAVRNDYTYRIGVTFQVVIELQLAQPHVAAWLRQHPDMSQTLIDAMYFLSRQWVKGDRALEFGAGRAAFTDYLVARMNLRELKAEGGGPAGAAEETQTPAEPLSIDDLKLLNGLLDDMLVLLCQASGETVAKARWEQLPVREWAPQAKPGLAVLQAMLMEDKSLLIRDGSGDAVTYEWRYRPSGVLRDPPVGAAAFAGLATGAAPGLEAVELEAAWNAVDRIRAIDDSLSALLSPATPRLEFGQVFELLADRLRIVPTTPAWQPVRAAVANLESMRVDANAGNRATLAEDIRSVVGFVEMLGANARAVTSTLVMAAFCGAAALEVDLAEALRRGLQALSVGLQFARTDLMRIEQAIRGLDAHAERAFGVSVIEAELARRSLDDAELGDDVRKAFDAGRARWGVLSRQEIASAAWAEVNRRLALLLRGHEQSVASLEELLCAVVPTGPAKVLGLDFEATTLANWTSALAIAARITTNPVAKSREVPPWVIGHALNRLGSPTLDVADLRTLVRALLPAGAAPDPAEPEAIAEIVRTAGTARSSERPSAGRSRLALCVVGPDEGASMRSWTQPPRSGLALIVTQEQFALLAGKGLLNALRVPMVVAVGQDRLSGEPGTKTLNESVPRLLGKDGQAVVWVYPRREPGMRKPFVIDPQSPDEVLEYAQPPRSAPA